jgi:hypothetical protein
MPDFPVVKTNAIPDLTPIIAKHLNNLEDKVGIDSSVDPASLDYQVTAVQTQVNVDHDASGHHKSGAWHVGATAVTSSAAELNKLTGADANVTPVNLNKLVDGADIGITLHQHAVYTGFTNYSMYGTAYPNVNSGGKYWGSICFWLDTVGSLIPSKAVAYPANTLHILASGRSGASVNNLRIRFTISGAVFNEVFCDKWNANSANMGEFQWGGVTKNFTYGVGGTPPGSGNPPNSSTDMFGWGGTAPVWSGALPGDNHNFDARWDGTPSGDVLHVSIPALVAPYSNYVMTVEVISNGGNQGFDGIILGGVPTSMGFGNPGQACVFNLAGQLLAVY